MDLLALTLGALVGAALGVIAQSLFQPVSDRVVFQLRARLRPGRTDSNPIDGIWRSRYVYSSEDSPVELEDEHFLILRAHGDQVLGRSIPRPEGSALELDLKLDGSILTGPWYELTPAHQRRYHGACQLTLSHAGGLLSGTWIGFSRSGPIQTGPWTMQRVDTEIGRRAQRKYKNASDLAWRAAVQPAAEPDARPASA